MLAMQFRYSDPENVVRKKCLPPVPAYENWIESQTVQDLQAIQFNHNSIHMEALTIRERILTRKCPDVAHPVVYRGAVCADNGRFDRCESLWLHALELRQSNKVIIFVSFDKFVFHDLSIRATQNHILITVFDIIFIIFVYLYSFRCNVIYYDLLKFSHK